MTRMAETEGNKGHQDAGFSEGALFSSLSFIQFKFAAWLYARGRAAKIERDEAVHARILEGRWLVRWQVERNARGDESG